MSRSNVFAPNMLRLFVSILFAKLKQNSKGIVHTGTTNISQVIMARVGYAVSFLLPITEDVNTVGFHTF
jgi:hypothetical protein